jgi:septal ring factor EnvC (AmiA/AmiB activator)
MSTPVSAQGSYDMGIAQLRNEIAAKDAEIERLQSYIKRADAYEQGAEKTMQELRTEVERLQAALKDAADDLDHNGLPVEAKKTRRALEGK